MITITQTRIRTYENCKRYYYLNTVQKLAWPLDVSDRMEMRRGADFHLYIRQLILGFPFESLLIPRDDETMLRWVRNYCEAHPLKGFDYVYAEREVSALYSDVLWLGKFDALAVHDDRLIIFDWKTTSHPSDPDSFLKSPQTRLYRFLAKSCGHRLLEGGLHGFPAENIEMIYWFPEHPDRTVRLPYSEAAYEEDKTWLRLKAREMSSGNIEDYPMTRKTGGCSRCVYYAYCFPESVTALYPDEPTGPSMGPSEDEPFQAEFDFFNLPPEPDGDIEQVNF